MIESRAAENIFCYDSVYGDGTLKYPFTKKKMHIRFILTSSFYALCILLGLALSLFCLYEYSLDDDLTVIKFKKFHSSKDYLYPSLAFCFSGTTSFMDSRFQNSTDLSLKSPLPQKSTDDVPIKFAPTPRALDAADFIAGVKITEHSNETYDFCKIKTQPKAGFEEELYWKPKSKTAISCQLQIFLHG